MKASRLIEHCREKIKEAEENIELLQEDIHAYALKMHGTISQLLLEEDGFNESSWEMVPNPQSNPDLCNFHLYGGRHPLFGASSKDDVVLRPTLFNIMKHMSNPISCQQLPDDPEFDDFYYQNEEEGWTVTSSNGHVKIYFNSNSHAYNFITIYGLRVDTTSVRNTIDELSKLVKEQDVRDGADPCSWGDYTDSANVASSADVRWDILNAYNQPDEEI
jgi:hypothetical protein